MINVYLGGELLEISDADGDALWISRQGEGSFCLDAKGICYISAEDAEGLRK